jgi:CRISPR system Cascade subunit CasD
MLTGLLANALGWRHGDADRLQRLQERIRHASRCDRSGSLLFEYQTVELGADFMLAEQVGWTTRGQVERRTGGGAKTMTHQRRLEYHADSVHTVALALSPPGEEPSVASLEEALAHPSRPLFLGRKCCLPAAPILLERRSGVTLRDVLAAVPAIERRRQESPGSSVSAWWPSEEGEASGSSRLVPVTDERDWRNQVHGGSRLLIHGRIQLAEVADAR